MSTAEYAHKLTYLPLVTREQHPGALHGRITTLIANGELERAAGVALTPEHSRVMICGNPQMIDDTRQLLKQRDMQLSLSRRPGQWRWRTTGNKKAPLEAPSFKPIRLIAVCRSVP